MQEINGKKALTILSRISTGRYSETVRKASQFAIEEFLKNIENNLMSLDVRKVLKREFDRYNEILSNLTRSELQRYIAFRRILTGIILISDTYVASRVDKISSIYAQDIYVFLSQFR